MRDDADQLGNDDQSPPRTMLAAPATVRLYWLAILAAIVIGGYYLLFFEPDHTAKYGPGIVAPDPPTQTDPTNTTKIGLDGFTAEPVADFAVTARVLSRSHYSSGTESQISPVDLALGWGRMSDAAVLENIDISQSGRFYRWTTPRFPIPRKEIETCSANMHMIPSSDAVEDQLKAIERGQVVRIEGMLVNVFRDDGWRWLSSKTRNDTGHGACEVIYVQRVEVIPPAN